MTDVQSNHKRVVLQCLQWIGGRHLPYLLSSKGLKRGNGPGWLQSTSAGDSKGYFTTWRRSCVLTLQPIDRIFVWHQRRWTTSCQWLVQISSDRHQLQTGSRTQAKTCGYTEVGQHTSFCHDYYGFGERAGWSSMGLYLEAQGPGGHCTAFTYSINFRQTAWA